MYSFLRMPYSLLNTPDTFQREINVILSEVRWESEIVYLEDIVIFSRTIENII